MPVVSDTSPILNLAVIDRLTLIQEQFTTVAIYLKIFLSKVKALKIKVLQEISLDALNLRPALPVP
jgi:predicted nucleic acid-binding protein